MASRDPLSVREVEVLQLVARGLTDREVANQLIVSVLTVAAHLEHICAKLGVEGRAGAIDWANRNGLN